MSLAVKILAISGIITASVVVLSWGAWLLAIMIETLRDIWK